VTMDSWGLAIVAVTVLGYAAVSRRLDRTVVSGPMVFVGVGLAVGTTGLGWFDPGVRTSVIKAIVEGALTLVLFADASRIDLRALRKEVDVPARLLGIGLPLTIVAGALVAIWLLPELTFSEALVLAIVLAPTDAALGQAVVTDPRLPSRIRQGLNVESGLNDGLCVPLLFIALAFGETQDGSVSFRESMRLVLEEIGWGVVAGVAAGVLGALVVRHAVRRRLVEAAWLQVIPVSAALFAYGLAVALGGSGFIAAFVAGAVFGRMHHRDGGEVTYLVEESSLVLGAVTFLIFGAAILGPVLEDVTWQVVAVAVLSLTVVRMGPVALALRGTDARPPTVAYLGWFGPRGLASIVFATLIVEEADLPHTNTLLLTIFFTIGLSVLLHGMSARPLTDRYVAWFETRPRMPMEGVEVHEHRWRRPHTASAAPDLDDAVPGREPPRGEA
jgi:NhaP-type Na+/H+ or K+/H+ antiporter